MHMHDPLDGRLPFTLEDAPSGLGLLQDFWAWSFSTLHNTYLRGYIAEYLVLKALQAPQSLLSVPVDHLRTKIEGDIHDLIFFIGNQKYTVQVKSKDSYATNEAFKTSFARGFDPATGKNTAQDHWSDIYVFAYLKLDKAICDQIKRRHERWNKDHNWEPSEKPAHKQDQHTLAKSVIALENWSFYVLPHAALKGRLSIPLNDLRNEATEVTWQGLAREVRHTAAYHGPRRP